MAKIEKLTKEQQRLLKVYEQKWLHIGLETEPANRKRAENGIRAAYRVAKLAPPKHIIWCQSPIGMFLSLYTVEALIKSVWAGVGDGVWAGVWDGVRDGVRDGVGAGVWDGVGDKFWRNLIYGAHDAHWLGFYDYFARVLKMRPQTKALSGLWQIAQNAGWFVPFENVCFICERHNALRRDTQGRLHAQNAPAIEYPDGWGVYYWHGLRVAAEYITDPVTIERIENERNTELRRVLVERYGEGNYVRDSGAEIVASDPMWGDLYRKHQNDDEDIYVVRVENATPEQDGTRRVFWLPIDPRAYGGDAGRVVQAAVASTWRIAPDNRPAVADWRNFQPLQQT